MCERYFFEIFDISVKEFLKNKRKRLLSNTSSFSYASKKGLNIVNQNQKDLQTFF